MKKVSKLTSLGILLIISIFAMIAGISSKSFFILITSLLASTCIFIFIISKIYEKAIVAIILLLAVMLFLPLSNATTLTYNFESDTIGSDPAEWDISESSNTNVQIYNDVTKACFLADNNGGHYEFCSMQKDFSANMIKDDITWSFDVKVNEDTDWSIFEADLGGGVAEITIRILNTPSYSRSIYVSSYDEETYHFLNNYQVGAWKTITVKIYNLNFTYSASDGTNTIWGDFDPNYAGVNWTLFVTDPLDSDSTDNDIINVSIDNVVLQWNEFQSTPPSVETLGATNIGPTYATLQGNLTSKGDATNITVGFQIGTFPGNYDETIIVNTNANTGKFNYTKDGLNSSTQYFYRAFATFENGTVYGDDVALFTASNEPPIASFEYTIKGMKVTVNASASYDPDGSIVLYEWDWESDGIFDENHTTATAAHTYNSSGNYTITLRVTDNNGAIDTATSDEGGGGIIIVKKNNILKLPFSWFAIFAIIFIAMIGIATSAFFLKPESIKALGYAPAAGTLLITIFIAVAIFMYYAGIAWYWIVADILIAIFILYVVLKLLFVKKKKVVRRLL